MFPDPGKPEPKLCHFPQEIVVKRLMVRSFYRAVLDSRVSGAGRKRQDGLYLEETECIRNCL